MQRPCSVSASARTGPTWRAAQGTPLCGCGTWLLPCPSTPARQVLAGWLLTALAQQLCHLLANAWRFQGHKDWVLCVAWSPDATHVASGDKAGVIWLWNPATGQALGTCKGGRVQCCTVAPHAGLHHALGWAAGHTKWITSIAWEPAHRQLPCRRFVSGSKDATVKVDCPAC